MDRPGIYLHKIQAETKLMLSLESSLSTLCRYLHSQGFSRQKMQLIARQRDEVLCAAYANEVAIHCADMFVFLDETGFD